MYKCCCPCQRVEEPQGCLLRKILTKDIFTHEFQLCENWLRWMCRAHVCTSFNLNGPHRSDCTNERTALVPQSTASESVSRIIPPACPSQTALSPEIKLIVSCSEEIADKRSPVVCCSVPTWWSQSFLKFFPVPFLFLWKMILLGLPGSFCSCCPSCNTSGFQDYMCLNSR